MDITKLQTIPYPKFSDERGYFAPSPIENIWVQENLSSSMKGVLRGMHLQKGTSAQSKLVRVLTGKVLDVVIDLRPDSPNYLQISSFELSPNTPEYLLVPKGFAHGFISLEDNTLFQYRVDAPYDKDAESSIHWQSPEIASVFLSTLSSSNLTESVLSLSEKDTQALHLQDWLQSHSAL